MISVQFATSKDKDNWNHVAELSDYGTIFHTWEWKCVIEQSFGDTAYSIVAKEDDKIVGIFPLFSRPMLVENKFHKCIEPFSNNFQVLWSPHPRAWGYGGPIALPDRESVVIQSLFNFAEQFVHKNKRFVDWRISSFCDPNIKNIFLRDNEYLSNVRQTSILKLSEDVELLWNNLKKQTRNGVRKAIKENIEVVEASHISEIKEMYRILCKDLYERTEIPRNPYIYFRAIWDILVPAKKAKFLLARYDGKLIGSIILFYHESMMFYEHAASLRQYSKLQPNNVLLWKAIEEGSANGFKFFDLGGMPLDEEDGIYKFKNGWGGDITDIGWYRKRFRYVRVRNLAKKLK